MAKSGDNNAKNASTGHILFEFYDNFYLRVLFKEDVNPRSKSQLAKKLADKLR